MRTATVTEFRSRMKEQLKEIEDNQDILILTGPKKMDFVVLTLEQYNAMEETAHLLSTQANAIRLMESIAQDRQHKGKVRQLKSPGKKSTPRKPVKTKE